MKRKNKTLTANFELQVGDEKLAMSATVPDRNVSALELIPVYQQLTDDVVSYAIQQTENKGQRISCKAGCGECCAQAVPVTTLEAENLALLVRRMPAAQQARVRERFAHALKVIQEVGMLQALQNMPDDSAEKRRELGVAYFKLGLYCPFLENQSCSIYQDRPLQCREYLVTSDPKHCANLEAKEIKHIDSRLKMVRGLRSFCQAMEERETSGWMLMLFSLDWAKDNKRRLRKKHGGQWLKEFVYHVVGRKLKGR